MARVGTAKKQTKRGGEARCWPGYAPVPGKPAHAQGSCRPEAQSKLDAGERRFRSARRRQLDAWQAKHPESPRSAAQHLEAPASEAPRQSRRADAPVRKKATAGRRAPAKGPARARAR